MEAEHANHRSKRGSLTRLTGIAMILVGGLLLTGVAGFYGYGLYSSAQIDELNVSIEGPLTPPSADAAFSFDLPARPATAVSQNSAASSDRTVPTTALARPMPSASMPSSVSATDATPEQTVNATGEASVAAEESDAPIASEDAAVPDASAVTLLLAAYSATNAGPQTHPKYWDRPLLAGQDTFEPGQNTQPTGFIPVDVAGLSPAGTLSAATRVRIPSIGVDSAIAPLEVVGEGDDAYYESPVNVVGVIPGTAHPGESGNGWLFGHLESPLRGEGNVFHKLPEIPAMLVSGDPVYISLESATGEYLYQIVSSTVVPQEELQIYETDDATITLVTCSRRPFYDHRQVVTAKLVAYRPA